MTRTWNFIEIFLWSVAVIVVGVLLWLLRPQTIKDASEEVLKATLRADGKVLMHYAYPEENSLNSLNANKIERIYRELVLPRYSRIYSEERIITDVPGKHQAVSELHVRTAGNRDIAFMTCVYPANGRYCTPVTGQIVSAWCEEFVDKHRKMLNERTRQKAILSGYAKNAAILKELGIVVLALGPGRKLYRISDLEKGDAEPRGPVLFFEPITN